MKTFVYMLTRKDNQKYIGITVDFNKRLKCHERSERFELGIKQYKIMKICETYEEAEQLETTLIKEYDTFYNGLNSTIDGKGNHLAPSFTTKGYKFSDQSKLKMSLAKKGKPTWNKGLSHSEKTKRHLSEMRKGKAWGPRKISYNDAKTIIYEYENNSLIFDREFILQFVKKTDKHKIDDIHYSELKTPNGKKLNKIKLYSEYYASIFSTTPQAIRRILINGISEDAK